MEALSKAPGAETAVREGDKRRQSWGLGVAMGGPPHHQHFLFKGGFKGRQRDRERAERWMRCLSDPLCPYPPPPSLRCFHTNSWKGTLMMMTISLPVCWRRRCSEGEGDFSNRCRQACQIEPKNQTWRSFFYTEERSRKSRFPVKPSITNTA